MPTPSRHRLWIGLIFWLAWACSVAAGSYRPATSEVGDVAEVHATGVNEHGDRRLLGDGNGHALPADTAITGDPRHVEMSYDGLDRMLTETSVGVTHTNSWDKHGNRLQVVQGRTGRIVQSGYDHLNRLVRMEERLPSESQPRTTLYSYDRNGNVEQKAQANGLVELTEYDALNRRTRQELKQGTDSLNSYSYAYDRQSNLCGLVESFAQTSAITVAGQTITNIYDKAYRLIEEDVTKDGKRVTTSYSHDAANNRTQKSVLTRVSGQPDVLELHTYTYGDASNGLNSNQLATWTRSNGPQVTYTYDANGNRATRVEGSATDTYTYDYLNRLIELNSQSGETPGTYRYAYDHRTRRVVRDESAVTGRTRDLIVFSSGLSAQEYTGVAGSTPTGQPHVEYMRGSDWGGGVGGILYSLTDGQPSWSHNNGRGDITARTDATGALTYAASYEAYGQRTQEAGSNPTRQQANSKDEDPTGLLNEGFRYRDLETGMFITRDPAGFVDGPNVYTYVQQNPWSKFDALGLFWDPDSGVWGFSQYLSFGKAMFVDPTVETYKAGCQHFEDGFRMYDAGEYTLGTLHMLAGTGKVAEIGATVASAGESAVVSKVTSKVASHIDDAAKASSKAASFMDDAGDAVENVSKVATETVGGSARKTAASLSDEEFVQRIADKCEAAGGRLGKGASGTGHAQGTWKHDRAKRLLERYKKTTNQKLDLETEVSFKGLKDADYGTKGSSRLDVFNRKTGEAFDYKFVKNPGKGLTAAQKNRNLKNVPDLKKQTEINPRVP